MLQREFFILLIEKNKDRETKLMHQIAGCMPEGMKPDIRWHRHMRDGLRMLVDRNCAYDFDMVVISEGQEADQLCAVLDILRIRTEVCQIPQAEEDEELSLDLIQLRAHESAEIRA